MKKCSKCNIEKQLINFNKRKNSIDGLRPDCKDCRKLESKIQRDKNQLKLKTYFKEYSVNNKEKLSEYHKQWFIKNKDKQRAAAKKYREKNKISLREKTTKNRNLKYKTDSFYRFKIILRSRSRRAFKVKSWKKNMGTEKLLGSDFNTVKLYIQNKFTEGMNWENQGEWHIDHIKPLALAKNKEELILLCHYTNLQPLWALDNIIKSNKIY
jgi:hypothetical protein